MVTLNAIVIKILNFLEFNVIKTEGSEIEGVVKLHVSLYHRKTHFLKFVSKVNKNKIQVSTLKTFRYWSHSMLQI